MTQTKPGDYSIEVPCRRCELIGERRTPEGHAVKVYSPADCTDEERFGRVVRFINGETPYSKEIGREIPYWMRKRS